MLIIFICRIFILIHLKQYFELSFATSHFSHYFYLNLTSRFLYKGYIKAIYDRNVMKKWRDFLN